MCAGSGGYSAVTKVIESAPHNSGFTLGALTAGCPVRHCDHIGRWVRTHRMRHVRVRAIGQPGWLRTMGRWCPRIPPAPFRSRSAHRMLNARGRPACRCRSAVVSRDAGAHEAPWQNPFEPRTTSLKEFCNAYSVGGWRLPLNPSEAIMPAISGRRTRAVDLEPASEPARQRGVVDRQPARRPRRRRRCGRDRQCLPAPPACRSTPNSPSPKRRLLGPAPDVGQRPRGTCHRRRSRGRAGREAGRSVAEVAGRGHRRHARVVEVQRSESVPVSSIRPKEWLVTVALLVDGGLFRVEEGLVVGRFASTRTMWQVSHAVEII